MLQLLKSNIFVRFIALFLMFYGIIQAIGYVPQVSEGYRSHYMNMTEKLFGDFRKDGIVKPMVNENEEEKELDVMLLLSSEPLYKEAIEKGTNVRIAKSFIITRFLGFFPLSIILALLLATPLTWKQKIPSLLVGVGLIQLFIIFRLWLHIIYVFHDNEWLEIVNLSPSTFRIVDFLGGIFIYNVVVVVLVPFVVWMLVAVLPFPRSAIAMKLNSLLQEH